MSDASQPRLTQKDGRIYLALGAQPEVPVRLAWARPLTGWGREVAALGEDRREVFLIPDVNLLDNDSRLLALDVLDTRYFLPRILKVFPVRSLFGYRYWHVVTDRGPRRFVMKNPAADLVKSNGNRWVIRDSLGGRYEITDSEALDPASRRNLSAAF